MGGTGSDPEVLLYGSEVGDGSNTGRQNAAVGACVDVGGFGGYAQVGQGACHGVVDGLEGNPSNGAGYAGYNTGCVSDSGKDTSCDANETGSGYNSGGCFRFKGAGPVPAVDLTNAVTALFFCGATSGPDWADSPRDGCSFP